MPTALTKENFKREALESAQPVLIDFWAPWCAPCRMVSPIVDEVAEEKKDEVKVLKVNIDEEPELAAQYNVMSIPTLMVMKGGKVVNTIVGMRNKQAILDLLG